MNQNRLVMFFMAVIFLITLCAVSQAGEGPMEILSKMEPAYAGVEDYTATFIKQERVKGEMLPVETIYLKFKKPFKVYMKWLPGPHKGREALYVQGKYDDKVIGHEGGLFGFVTLHMKPAGSTAMRGNRHPITDAGIGRMIEIIMENVRRASKEGALEVKLLNEDTVLGRKTSVLSISSLAGKEKGYYAKNLEVWVDKELNLPIKLKAYGWQDELLESYEYKDLKLNPGIPDAEFDEDNKDYGF